MTELGWEEKGEGGVASPEGPPPYENEYVPVDPNTVARQILWLREQAGVPTSPLHLVKLVYLCHSWMLGLKDRPLINEPIVVGRYGPIVQSLHDRYRGHGAGPILDRWLHDRSHRMDHEQNAIIKVVAEAYGDFEDTQLSEITHMEGTPWSIVSQEGEIGTQIPDQLIREHYKDLIRDRVKRLAEGERGS